MKFIFSFVSVFYILIVVNLCWSNSTKKQPKKKKDLRDYTDYEIEALYDEWESNDEDVLPDDEKPPHLQPKKQSIDLNSLKEASTNPEDMMRLSKKGQMVMMFVAVVNPNGPTTKSFSNKLSTFWQNMLNNNHIVVQTYVIEDNRLLFSFEDGLKAWEARDVLVKQIECKEVVLEGKTFIGLGGKSEKNEL